MVKRIALFLFFNLFFSVFLVWAQQDNKEQIAPGMQSIWVGSTELIVPKDLKIRKEGGLIILENTTDYVARKVQDMQARIDNLSEELENVKKQVEQFKKIIKALKRNLMTGGSSLPETRE